MRLFRHSSLFHHGSRAPSTQWGYYDDGVLQSALGWRMVEPSFYGHCKWFLDHVLLCRLKCYRQSVIGPFRHAVSCKVVQIFPVNIKTSNNFRTINAASGSVQGSVFSLIYPPYRRQYLISRNAWPSFLPRFYRFPPPRGGSICYMG